MSSDARKRRTAGNGREPGMLTDGQLALGLVRVAAAVLEARGELAVLDRDWVYRNLRLSTPGNTVTDMHPPVRR